ncbi:suppressor of fused domain protein [Ruminococcus sp.]|uniref:suppressor of fused domain protein n=1 Tax=Ruminococcus sp. TaxID=41978 RepID=UPI0026001AD4|nr:suppressor of fused domain protein [Ruminococcus sp.]MEE0241022.1 suppressor of fused domain protein [Ruminococcus sp.]
MTLEELIFNEAYDAFLGDAEEISYKVFAYLDEKTEKSIDILTGFDTPCVGSNSYATLGLSNLVAKLEANGKPLTVELVSACDISYDLFPNIVSTCAFQIMDGTQCYRPGAVITDVVSMYYPEFDMKHMLMAYPFLWDGALHTLTVKQKYVAWLQMIPVSEKEYQYILKHGYDALEDLFEKEQIDVLDLERRSLL